MKSIFKILLTFFLGLILVSFLTLGIIFITPSKIELDPKKLITTSDFISFYDRDNNLIAVSDSLKMNEKVTCFSDNLINAFVAIEDKNFFKHKGVDFKRIIKASLVNLKNRSFSQGASTISQQLIKNTHLTNEKTLSRKITEIKLTRQLEKLYTKQEILSMYLNTIYFGENCFGITSAAKRFFDKSVSDLTLSECASLAATISAPSKLNPCANIQANINRRNLVLKRMLELKLIDEAQYNAAINEKLTVNSSTNTPYNAYLNACFNELNNIEKLSPYTLKNCKVLTYYNPALQEYICDIDNINCDYQNIVLDNASLGVLAYASTCGEIGREIASTAKPIAVFAPAIDKNIITPYTIIKDEETSFGDYKPTNFGDKFYGNVSVETALIKSLNVPAVKVLDYLGIDTAISYLNKMNIPCKNKGLSLALGNLASSVYLKDLAASYTTFANYGIYKKPHFIKQIIDNNNNILYNADFSETSVFKSSTATLINDMLKKTKNSGTAKKLSYIDFDLAVKTGTGGTKAGNTDCYSVGYTTQNTFAVWIGNASGVLLDNRQTGSNLPTTILGKTATYLYKDNNPLPFKDYQVTTKTIDKLYYENTGEVLLASPNTPKKHTFIGKFAIDNTPGIESTIFTQPKISDLNVQINDNLVTITFVPSIGAKGQIYRILGGQKTYLGESDGKFVDKLLNYGVYEYEIIPYCDGVERVFGQEHITAKLNYEQKKAPDGKTDGPPDEWWFD